MFNTTAKSSRIYLTHSVDFFVIERRHISARLFQGLSVKRTVPRQKSGPALNRKQFLKRYWEHPPVKIDKPE